MLLVLPAGVQAQDEDRHWDVNDTDPGGGGTGTWDTSTNIWSPNDDGVSGPYVAPWDNTALDNAIFGGAAGTVTLGEPITVHDLTFNSAGYVLTGSQLTLGAFRPPSTQAAERRSSSQLSPALRASPRLGLVFCSLRD